MPEPEAIAEEKGVAAQKQEEETVDLAACKRCVACNAVIPATAGLCPKCGWTQPDIG